MFCLVFVKSDQQLSYLPSEPECFFQSRYNKGDLCALMADTHDFSSMAKLHSRRISQTKPSPSVLTVVFQLVLLVASVGVSAAVPLLTIESPDGDIIECINITDQPAFSDPLLRYHKLQETPTNFPNIANGESVKWQIWHQNRTTCPEGTIPIRKVTPSYETSTKIIQKVHEYGIGRVNTTTQIYGTRATMNVWNPRIEPNSGEFSLGQVWLVSGSNEAGDLNTIEAGWQVYPQLYLDNQPRLFIFWTRDAYNTTRCYNLRCPGFVQTSRNVLIEGAISPTSTFEGNQTDLTIQIWKDPMLGHWWLAVGFNNDTNLELVGYWPTEIYTRLVEFAQMVSWGGEITNQNLSGRHTTTQMGSGYLSSNAYGKSAYMRNLEIVVNKTEFQPVYSLVVGATNPEYYNAKKSSETSFYYGGSENSKAVGRKLDVSFLFLTLSLLLFF